MRRQKTITVHGEKIKMVSTTACGGMHVITRINGKRYFINFEIMTDYEITSTNHKEVYEEFIRRAREIAFGSWVKEFGKTA